MTPKYPQVLALTCQHDNLGVRCVHIFCCKLLQPLHISIVLVRQFGVGNPNLFYLRAFFEVSVGF